LDAEVEINSAWKTIKENINISAKESLGIINWRSKSHGPMNKQNSVAFSLQANYAHQVIAADRNFVPTFAARVLLRGQYGGPQWPLILFSRPEPLLSLSSSSPFILTRPSESRCRPTTTQKIW
jgi:hypothetical protein